MSEQVFSHIDLFAGAGGLSEGLSQAGFHSLFANEVVPVYASTYARNHIGSKVVTDDIRSLNADHFNILSQTGLKYSDYISAKNQINELYR